MKDACRVAGRRHAADDRERRSHRHNAPWCPTAHRSPDGPLDRRVRDPCEQEREDHGPKAKTARGRSTFRDLQKREQRPVPQIQWIADQPDEHDRPRAEQRAIDPRARTRPYHQRGANRGYGGPPARIDHPAIETDK